MLRNSKVLPSYRDWSKEQFQQEMARVEHGLQVERAWFDSLEDVSVFETDKEIVEAHDNGVLVVVNGGTGFAPIKRLREWTPDRSNPSHEFHYSPPFLVPEARFALEAIALSWSRTTASRALLSVTSMTRSAQYQRGIVGADGHKIAVDPDIQPSSHQTGYAFDVDGCGVVIENGDRLQAVNPRQDNYPRYRKLIGG